MPPVAMVTVVEAAQRLLVGPSRLASPVGQCRTFVVSLPNCQKPVPPQAASSVTRGEPHSVRLEDLRVGGGGFQAFRLRVSLCGVPSGWSAAGSSTVPTGIALASWLV
jgi:hypothetical protein